MIKKKRPVINSYSNEVSKQNKTLELRTAIDFPGNERLRSSATQEPPGDASSWRHLSETFRQRSYRVDSSIRAFSRSNHAELFSSDDFPSSSEPLQTPSPIPKPPYSTYQLSFVSLSSSDSSFFDQFPILARCVSVLQDSILACPICYQRLESDRDSPLSLESVSGSSLQCITCRKTYFGNDTHFELTASSDSKTYGDPMPVTTEIFRTPLVSFLYERGWRQSFSIMGGFPGPEEEFGMSKRFLEPAFGGRIVDASCGSGMFSRLFAKSGLFSNVVALDYSENMLKECHDFIKQEPGFPKEKISLVRADIARLPFVSGSVDAVHAGAALHCWPSPLAAVAEISRVLRPGGVFVATTYIIDGPFNFVPITRNFIVQSMRQLLGNTSFQSEQEMQDLCEACGLVGFTCIRNRAFVMISATKPS